MSDWADEEYAGAVLAGDIDAGSVLAAVDDPEGDPDGGGEPTLYYGSVDEFVREYLRTVYRRAINGRSRVWAARLGVLTAAVTLTRIIDERLIYLALGIAVSVFVVIVGVWMFRRKEGQ